MTCLRSCPSALATVMPLHRRRPPRKDTLPTLLSWLLVSGGFSLSVAAACWLFFMEQKQIHLHLLVLLLHDLS